MLKVRVLFSIVVVVRESGVASSLGHGQGYANATTTDFVQQTSTNAASPAFCAPPIDT